MPAELAAFVLEQVMREGHAGAARQLRARAVVGVRMEAAGETASGGARALARQGQSGAPAVSAWTCGLVGGCLCKGAEGAGAAAGLPSTWDAIASAVQSEGGLPAVGSLSTGAAGGGAWGAPGGSSAGNGHASRAQQDLEETGESFEEEGVQDGAGSSPPALPDASVLDEDGIAAAQTQALHSILKLAKRMHKQSRSKRARSSEQRAGAQGSYPALLEFAFPVLL